MENPIELSTSKGKAIQRISALENAIARYEPFSELLIKHLSLVDFLSLARTSSVLRQFVFSRSSIWRDLRPCTPEEVLQYTYPLGVGSWTRSLEVWRTIIGEYQKPPRPGWVDCYKHDTPPELTPKLHLVPYHSQELTGMFLGSIFGNLVQGISMVRLNLDGMPVTGRVLFSIVERLKGTLEELSLRFCLRLRRQDLVDLLQLPISDSSGQKQLIKEKDWGSEIFPTRLKRLNVSFHIVSYQEVALFREWWS